MKLLLLFALILVMCLAVPAHASTINAISCSSADVQAAINSASNGDTVVIPSGSCSWTSQVNISRKGITLQGQTTCTGTPVSSCTDNTNIIDNGSGGNSALAAAASATNFVRITGITITEGSGANQANRGMINVGGTIFDVAFRIDHVHLVLPYATSRGIQTDSVYGLIDHVLIDETGGLYQVVSMYGSPDGTDGGFTPWMQPLTLGTNKAVYIEDSTFTFPSNKGLTDSGMDSYGGARWVFRHNNVTNNEFCSGHGTDSGNRRSFFSGECYNNTFTNNSTSVGTFRAGTVRGGTGVWHDNTYVGSWGGVNLQVFRACDPGGGNTSAWGHCDGTQWEIGSTDSSTDASRTCTASPGGGVKFCSGNRDLVCTTDSNCSSVGAGTCSTYFDGAGSEGYNCRDQPGTTHGQVVSPVYTWNNGSQTARPNNGGASCSGGNDISFWIASGRDYVNGSAMPGYSAYTYPHPLQGKSPAPPTNLLAQ